LEDYKLVLAAAVFFFVYRLLNNILGQALATTIGVSKQQTGKFQESMFKQIVFQPLTLWGAFMTYKYALFPDVSNAFSSEQQQGGGIPDDVRLRYMLGLGWYIYATVSHALMDEHNGFVEVLALMSHHVVTFAVLFASYVSGFHMIGIFVLVLHDVGEVIVDGSKLCVYIKAPMFIQALSYVALLVSWFYTRLYIFPLYVIHATWFEAPRVMGGYTNVIYGCNACLAFLLCLHIYWFLLIIRLGYRILSGQDMGKPKQKKH
jgi:hypothetical protein